MANTCLTCRHPQREAIERDLVDSVTLSAIAARYRIGRMSLARHKRDGHIGAAVYEGARLRKEVLGGDLLDKLLALEVEGLAILGEAKTLRESEGARVALNLALNAIGRVAGLIETEVRLVEAAKKSEFNVQVAIVQDPSWAAVLRLLTDSLRPHPLAFRQVVEGLRNLNLLPAGGNNGGQAG